MHCNINDCCCQEESENNKDIKYCEKCGAKQCNGERFHFGICVKCVNRSEAGRKGWATRVSEGKTGDFYKSYGIQLADGFRDMDSMDNFFNKRI